MEPLNSWLELHRFPTRVAVSGDLSIDTAALVVIVFAALVGFFFKLISGQKSKAQTVDEVLTKERRSVMKYAAPADYAVIEKAVLAAIHAPNHWLTQPWRYRLLGERIRNLFSDLNEKKRDIFEQVPQMMLITQAKESDAEWDTKTLEDHAAVSCATQNLMVSLASEGIGSKWMTGALGIPANKILEICDVDEDKEFFMGVVFIGVPQKPLGKMRVPERKRGLDIFTTLE